MARLGDLFLHIRNGANIKQGLDDSGYPITRIETISNRVVDRNKMGYSGITNLDKYSDYIMQDGDILMSHINSETHLGKTALYNKLDDEIIIHGMNLLSLRPNQDLITSEYAFYYLSSQAFLQQIPNITKKSVNQASFTVSALKELFFPTVPIKEQKRITEKLDKVCDLISLQKQQLIKLDQLVKSRFVEMFGNVLSTENKPLVQLSEIVEIGSSKRIYANEYVDEGVPFYRSKEIRELGSGLKPSVELFIKQERYDEIKERYGVPKVGDILIAAIGATIGYSWIVDTDKPFYYKDGNLIILSIKDTVNPIFLNHLMGLLIDDFKNKGVAGSAQLALTIEKLEKMQVVNPDIDLQNQFATFVEQTDKLKLEVKKSLEKLETLKKSLVQQYFG